MGSCHFSCPAAILVSWEKAVLCSCPEIEENGEGENRKELGKNSRIALVSVNSCVDRMKPRFKRDLISKLCVEVRFWGYLLEGRFKKYFPVHSVNKHHVIESQSWAGRCFYFPAKFMQKSPNKQCPVIFLQPKMVFVHPKPLVMYSEDSKCVWNWLFKGKFLVLEALWKSGLYFLPRLASKSPLGNHTLQFIPSELCFGELNKLNLYLLMHITYWVGFSQPSFLKIVNLKGKSIFKSLKALKMTFTCFRHNPLIMCLVLDR